LSAPLEWGGELLGEDALHDEVGERGHVDAGVALASDPEVIVLVLGVASKPLEQEVVVVGGCEGTNRLMTVATRGEQLDMTVPTPVSLYSGI